MNYKQILNCLLAITIVICAQTNVAAQREPTTDNVILQWNRVVEQTIRSGVHPSTTIVPVRTYVMVHAAMFDAVNSIDKSYTPYLIEVPASPDASVDAAAAQAAHDVLVGLYPTRASVFDAELAKSLEAIPFGQARQGMIVGATVAARMLEFRANDGWTAPPPPYVLPPVPGNWQPFPPPFLPARYTQAPGVLPFAALSNTQFAPGPPPALTSVRYAADLNEVKTIGAVNSTTRTAEQTQIAQLWHAVISPSIIFFTINSVARNLVAEQHLSTAESARLFVLSNIAVHDAIVTSITAKYQYGLWRPVTAIRRADEDSNPLTEPDRDWLPLLVAQPHPSYTGDQAAVSMAQAIIFTLFFGRDDIAFQHTWENNTAGAPGWTRSYTSFTAMAQEAAESRIYGGIHYRFDQEAGQEIGRKAATYVFLNFMRPRNHPGR